MPLLAPNDFLLAAG